MRALPAVLLIALHGNAQELAFTSRANLQCPVAVQATQPSREYGFETVRLKNDAPQTVVAVRFSITLHSGSGDEIADERRVSVQLASQSTKTVELGLAQIKGLRDRLKSERQADGLAILTVSAVEFSDGSEWRPPDMSNSDLPASKPLVERKK